MKAGTRITLTSVALVSLALVIALGVYGRPKLTNPILPGQKLTNENVKEGVTVTQWEYLVVSGGSANLSTAGNESYPSMRKQSDNSFSREFFPLERNFDKLGAKGWELVSVYGSPNDPVYFFKRAKEIK
jgi:hypothetical protein